jgi:hypothetical protein
VFYVIRENRTYDQVLGDLTEGNGDPRLTLFGRDTTPNAHALAQNFVVFDNFYVDADVSYNGHSYSTAAYATDFVEKMWQTMYARGGVPGLSEGGGLSLRNPFGNISRRPAAISGTTRAAPTSASAATASSSITPTAARATTPTS